MAVEQATDGLFMFMAEKDRFAHSEIDTYESLLVGYGSAASPAIARNLERLLTKHKNPTKVYWALKLVALRALQRVGTSQAAPTVKKFLAARDAYVNVTTKTAADGVKRDVSSTSTPFATCW